MNIAIIGAGSVGSALGGSLNDAGHDVVFSASEKASAQETAQRVGGRAADSNREAVEGAQVVLLAVPYPSLDEVLGELDHSLADKVVVDVTNRVDPQNPDSVLDGMSVAEQIRDRAPGARVVKAFNTVFAARQASPVVDGMRADGYVAADDEDAKQVVLGLVESVGLRPIDAGPLVMARALEAMALLIIMLQISHEWPWQSAWKLIGPTGQEQ